MKKLATLLLAAGLVFGAATGASAIDFKAKGVWAFDFSYGQGSNFMDRDRNRNTVNGYGGRSNNGATNDVFGTNQRIRLQLEAVASEFLSGTVQFEIGQQQWGNAAQGAAMGADGLQVRVKHAYLDWMVPNTDLKVRMGIQPIALPAFTTGGGQVLDDDVAAVVLSYKFNDNVSLAFLWARPYNDGWNDSAQNNGNIINAPRTGRETRFTWDNVDLFSLLVPLSFDGAKVTPWVMFGMVAPNFARRAGSQGNGWTNANTGLYFGNFLGDGDFGRLGGNGGSYRHVLTGMSPAAFSGNNDRGYRYNYMAPIWLGLTGEITMADPFRFAWDFNYGHNNAFYRELSRSGWYLSLLAEYKLDWGTPGLYAWYASGDDSNPRNGSERMPTLYANGNNGFSAYAFNGPLNNSGISRNAVIGTSMMGTWGVGFRLKDMSFLEGLKHTLYINYIQGTNSPTMARYVRGANQPGRTTNTLYTDFNNSRVGAAVPLYLTSNDTALELSLVNTYQIYDNLTMVAQASYVAMWLDRSSRVWGDSRDRFGTTNTFRATDAWNVNVSFVYAF